MKTCKIHTVKEIHDTIQYNQEIIGYFIEETNVRFVILSMFLISILGYDLFRLLFYGTKKFDISFAEEQDCRMDNSSIL